MQFDKIQYKGFGPFFDVRFLRGGLEVATIRLIGDMPNERHIVSKLFDLFWGDGVKLQACWHGIPDWIQADHLPTESDSQLEVKPPRWMSEKDDRADAREEFDDGRARDCAGTIRELKG